jgi:ribosomal protein L9
MKYPDKIKEAIKAGEKENSRRLKEEKLKKQQEEEQQRAKQRRNDVYCDNWVLNELPSIIKKETAKGNRYYYLSGGDIAAACHRAGLKVEEKYEKESCDEGMWCGGWSYTLVW